MEDAKQKLLDTNINGMIVSAFIVFTKGEIS